MMFYVFALCLFISIGVLVFMTSRNYNTIDIHFWSMVIIIPIILVGYMLKTRANSVDDAKLAFCFIYLDSTVLLMLIFSSMLRSLGIRIRAWLNMLAYSVSFVHLIMFWVCKDTTLYYATFQVEKTPLGTVTRMTDGPLKMFHYIYLGVMLFAIVGGLIWCLIRKKDSSRKVIAVYSAFAAAAILIYAAEMLVKVRFSVLPVLYAVGDVVIAICYERVHSHDIECVVVDQKNKGSMRGFVALGTHKELLCYNENALFFIPLLEGKRIDCRFGEADEKLRELFYPLIDRFLQTGKASDHFSDGGTIFQCDVSYFRMHESGKPRGFLFEIHDVTAEQGYLNLIREYGQSMEHEVEKKTSHIRFIQQKIVLGMATIIENRDMNTGGHVRRTSDIIKILVEEMRRQNVGEIDESFAEEIIRSAPMHDLGKIAVDNAILNKPGKLNDEEYAAMKQHSAKSGEIVESMLEGVEEDHFVQTAYQLARFHHERWDGKGYPERLAEVEIPIEARIMAVADVYDALVSKRSYKEAMSFEKAAAIMLEGMGSQFDPMMKSVFLGCREQLEDYYRKCSGE